MTPELERGRRAKELLEHELVVAFFEEAEREIWDRWKSSPLRDAEGREKLRLMQEWLTKFRLMLESHVTTGRFAREALEEQQSMMDRLKSAITPAWYDAD